MPSTLHQPANPTKAFYDRISKVYDLISDSSEHKARDRGVELLDAAPGESVLVVGFGTGHAAAALGRAVAPGGKVSGVDISEGMLEVARKRIRDEGVANSVELSIGDARQLVYPDQTFDAAFISFTLELFGDSDIPRVLGQIYRVLRPGGRLAVVSMSKEPHETLMSDIYVWMHRHFPHFVDCRPIPVAEHLAQANFQVERLEKQSIWGLPVAIALARRE
jgi:demethylmenaquinone methyltransferase/2-methoxy-6-polyprenyl-1,4-benzoquinol methylase